MRSGVVMRPQTVSNEIILETARKIFIENGPHASVEMIAQKLGLSQPALFKRFGTKRKLMIEALRPPTEIPWITNMENGPDRRDFPTQLKELAGEKMYIDQPESPSIYYYCLSSVDKNHNLSDLSEAVKIDIN